MHLLIPPFYHPAGRLTVQTPVLPLSSKASFPSSPTAWSIYNKVMKYVPLYDGDENIGSVPFTTSLDTWDGMRWRHLHTGCHLGIGRLDDGRFYTCYSSDWPEGIVRRKKYDGTWEVLFRCEDDFGPQPWRW